MPPTQAPPQQTPTTPAQPAPTPSSANTADQALEASPAGRPLPPAEALEFGWNVHTYLNEYIRFADAKAGVVMAWCAALIGAMFSARVHECLLKWPVFIGWTWAGLVEVLGALAAFVLLVLAIVGGAAVIVPRLRRTPIAKDGKQPNSTQSSSAPEPAGLIYWDDILMHGDRASYGTALRQATPQYVADHNFVLAEIAKEKYGWVAWSVWIAAVGTAVAAVMIWLAPVWR